MLKILDEVKIGTLKLLDKLLIKIGLTRTASPSFKANAKEGSRVQQQSTQAGGDAYTAGGDLVIGGRIYTWSEKREAAEHLLKEVKSFFFSALSSDKLSGFLAPKNLPNAKMELERAQGRLRTAIKQGAPKLEEQDQRKLYKIQDDLLKVDMNAITEELREKILSSVRSILEKYL